MKLVFSALVCFLSFYVYAQSNFSYTPLKPQPGEAITIKYQKSGDLIDIGGDPMFYTIEFGGKSSKLNEYTLKENSDGGYSVTIKTDTSASFLALAFYIGEKFDNNKNDGYFIHLYNGDKIKEGSYLHAVTAITNLRSLLGIKRDGGKILDYYEKEMNLYPESKEKNYDSYLSFYYSENTDQKEKATALMQAQLEKLFKAGLNNEAAYNRIISLYNILDLREQSRLYAKLREEKYPRDESKSIGHYSSRFIAAKTIEGKEAVYNEVVALTKSNPGLEKSFDYFISRMKEEIYRAYITERNFDKLEADFSMLEKADKKAANEFYPILANQLIRDSSNYSLAVKYAGKAFAIAKSELKKPSEKQPNMMTKAAWERSLLTRYYNSLNTYALALYLNKEYAKALPFAKEVAFGKVKRLPYNATYALVAEKTVPVKTYKPILENWAREEAFPNEAYAVLKRTYVAEQKSDKGFQDYIDGLQQEKINEMIAELKSVKKDEPAPSFTLNDLSGNSVSLSELKGKIVVLDFWATWCGPCRASFPGMQKAVDKYKKDKDVQFYFVNTLESGADTEKLQKVKEYINQTTYTFAVLMDMDNEVKTNFKIEGIPTKIIIGKDGNVKFFSVGYEGSDDNVLRKVSNMIELARQ